MRSVQIPSLRLCLVLLLCWGSHCFRLRLPPNVVLKHNRIALPVTPSHLDADIKAQEDRATIGKTVAGGWTPVSWKDRPITQAPAYDDQAEVDSVVSQLYTRRPLVTPEDTGSLQKQLAKASAGEAFVLMGGDCAEALPHQVSKEQNTAAIHHASGTVQVLQQMAVILAAGTMLPVVKIGRMAGQSAKPRSEAVESRDGVTLPAYRGDLINGHEFSAESRRHDPQRMLSAYKHAKGIRIWPDSSAEDDIYLSGLHARNLEVADLLPKTHHLRRICRRVEESLTFMRALGMAEAYIPQSRTHFFTAHECLLLPYEQGLTRWHESRADWWSRDYYGRSAADRGAGEGIGRWYAGSAHMLWAGERTRHPDSAHMHFLSGVANPVGLKVSERCQPADLLQALDVLNPHNVPGRVTVVVRMGAAKLRTYLPGLIRAVQAEGRSVLWVCDPMHGNTIKTDSGYKTRPFERIIEEIDAFFDVHREIGTHPGGVHLEMTREEVTECMGGEAGGGVRLEDLGKRYTTLCDPRLNYHQSMEVAAAVATRLGEGRGVPW